MAITRNLYIDQGSEFYDEFPLTDSSGAVLNLSAFTAQATMKKSYSATDAIDLGANIPAPIEGKVSVYLSATDTSELTSGRYVYDMVIVEAISGRKIRVVEGIVVVNPGVTL